MRTIIFERIGRGNHVGLIRLNRPECLNAISTEVLDDIDEILKIVDTDDSIRCLVITGEGRSFSAGGDIEEEVKKTSMEGYIFSVRGNEVFLKMQHSRVPVIGAINGYALGGGMELALACDIRIASTKAKLGLPEIKLAVMPGFGGSQRLSRLVTISKAKQIMLTGDMLTAEESYRIGLVDEMAEPEKLMDVAIEMADKIAGWGPLAVKNIKSAIVDGIECDMERAVMLEAHFLAQLFGTEDQIEGMTAFLEKRPPREFKGR